MRGGEMSKENRIKYYREKAGISVEEMAKALGYSQDYIRKLEKGQRGLSMETGIAISKLLGKSLNTLFMP